MPRELIIGDNADLSHPALNYGGKGLIARNWATHPQGCYASAPPAQIPLIPPTEWSQRIKDKVAAKSQTSDIRMRGNAGQMIDALDQGQVGYCWAHSSTSAVTMLRALMGLPYVPLSAYAIAATIKKGADEGGWGAESMDFATDKGIPSQALWPQGDREYEKYQSKPEVWANAALHKVTNGWIDLSAAQYDRKLTFDQVGTLLLSNVPIVVDYNWWSHSVCAIDLVETTPGQFGVRILNSWGNSWSDHGMGILEGEKAIPDSAVAPLVTIPSDV